MCLLILPKNTLAFGGCSIFFWVEAAMRGWWWRKLNDEKWFKSCCYATKQNNIALLYNGKRVLNFDMWWGKRMEDGMEDFINNNSTIFLESLDYMPCISWNNAAAVHAIGSIFLCSIRIYPSVALLYILGHSLGLCIWRVLETYIISLPCYIPSRWL